jgi:hypothetical protein
LDISRLKVGYANTANVWVRIFLFLLHTSILNLRCILSREGSGRQLGFCAMKTACGERKWLRATADYERGCRRMQIVSTLAELRFSAV